MRMASHKVECLRCGAYRSVSDTGPRRVDTGECPRCGYVGWVPAPNGARIKLRYDLSMARRLGRR